MQEPPGPLNISGEVVIQLIDPISGRPVNSWSFKGQERITIGRSPNQDVELSDPYVSRCHALLVRRDEGWFLVSLGRHGLVVANQSVKEQAAGREMLFRLGAEGPTLKFFETDGPFVAGATISFSTEAIPMFQLDELRLQCEVQEITDGDYFQNLQCKVRDLRNRRRTV